MKLTTVWTCPRCDERVPIHLDALTGIDRSRIKVRVRVPDTALVDAIAHAWTHEDVGDQPDNGNGECGPNCRDCARESGVWPDAD